MDSLTNQCKRISTRLLPPGLVFSTEGRTKGGWAGLRPELAWLVRAETPARRRSDGRLPREASNRCRSATNKLCQREIFGRCVYLPISSR